MVKIPVRESELKAAAVLLRPARLLTGAFRGLAAARRARAFHPLGVPLDGALTVEHRGPLPLPLGTHPLVARLSKGAGRRGDKADVLGLALRIELDGEPWDLALSSSGTGRLGRMLPKPAGSWRRTRFGSILPYRVDGKRLWISALAHGGDEHWDTADLAAVPTTTSPLLLSLQTTTFLGRWTTAATLALYPNEGMEQPSFDPMRNCPRQVRMVPHWLREARELAYRGSRSGRRSTG